MSWFATNYEKAALGGASLCALALAFFGYSSLQRVEDDFVNTLRGAGKNDTAVANADRVTNATASLNLDRTWEPRDIDGRNVDLLVAVPLFVTAQDPSKPIDLLKDEPVHPPIPNIWWIENRIDPGFDDSPTRDPDADGFTNLEEFTAQTNPNDIASHPPLITKLKFVREEHLAWVIRPNFEDNGRNTFRYTDSERRVNRTPAETPIEPGGTFFSAEPSAARFKLLRHETRDVFNPRIDSNESKTFAFIEDLRPNKAGTVYEFPAPLPESAQLEHLKYDRTAVFTLEAVGKSGVEFKVEEFTTFTLPHDQEGPLYKVLNITAAEVVVEYPAPDGTTQSVTIPVGSMPQG